MAELPEEAKGKRYEVHMGLFDSDESHSCYGFLTGGSGVFEFHTDSWEQAYRTFYCIDDYMPDRETFLGMYINEKLMWRDGVRHPEWSGEPFAVIMRWFLEDYETDGFDSFDVCIYEEG